MTHRLIYVSRNALTGPVEEMDREVFSILDISRRNNQRDGLTGALLFNNDCFAQVLEGEAAAVRLVFERIQLDLRHRDTVVLQYGPAPREFGDWSMAFIGRVEKETARYAALTGPDTQSAAADRVLDLLRGVVLRTSQP